MTNTRTHTISACISLYTYMIHTSMYICIHIYICNNNSNKLIYFIHNPKPHSNVTVTHTLQVHGTSPPSSLVSHNKYPIHHSHNTSTIIFLFSEKNSKIEHAEGKKMSSSKGRTTIDVGPDGVAVITIINPPVNSLSFDGTIVPSFVCFP